MIVRGQTAQRADRATGIRAQVLVIAKAPVPGRVKTRLTPPLSPTQAAQLAEAALADTLTAAGQVPAAGHLIALDGGPGAWLPPGFQVIRQRGRGLDERIAAALSDAYARWPAPVALIGMDTPQVTPELLASAIQPLADGTADATYGPAADGGFWLLGLRRPDQRLVLGVPMSTDRTGAAQLDRLVRAGLRVHHLPPRIDVDSVADAVAVAREIPRSRFAAALRTMLDPAVSALAPDDPGLTSLRRADRQPSLTTLLPARTSATQQLQTSLASGS